MGRPKKLALPADVVRVGKRTDAVKLDKQYVLSGWAGMETLADCRSLRAGLRREMERLLAVEPPPEDLLEKLELLGKSFVRCDDLAKRAAMHFRTAGQIADARRIEQEADAAREDERRLREDRGREGHDGAPGEIVPLVEVEVTSPRRDAVMAAAQAARQRRAPMPPA